jgi:predicted signal transduction protein with EAL and GGDEF domain
VAGDERDARRPRDLARAWTRALEHIAQPEQRLRAILTLARPLAGAQRALVFGEDGVLAAAPGAPDGPAVRRLFERARAVLEDELVTPELYVARIVPERPERVALAWRSASAASLEAARAIVVSCAWALENGVTAAQPPAGLPDGAETLHRLEQLVHDARRMQRSFAVIYVDVEAPPSATGGVARDALARRLRREVRANDHIGHLGDDAFLVLVSLGAGEAEAYPAAQRLLRAAAAASPDASVNVGVAICPQDGLQPDGLVEKASAAAMAAASAGGTQPYWYRESAGRMLRQRSLLRARLSDGDPAAVVDLRYQPIFDANTGVPCAVSATMRWHAQSELGAVHPLEYLAGEPDRAAREALERWTIASAAEAYRTLRAAGCDLRVHLALTAHDDATVDAVADAFGAGDAMRRVWIEIAPADVAAPGVVASFARRLRALGASVGVGAWRTSRPPFDAIDTGLLDFVTVDERADARSLAALALASMLAPVVIAGGVSDPERARWLARHGATAVRGDGLAVPMGLHELVRWASNQPGPVET